MWPPRPLSWSPASVPMGAGKSPNSPMVTAKTTRFFTKFLPLLNSGGLDGTHLVISDAHVALESALATVMVGASLQRCRVHFLRNVLAQIPKGSSEKVAAAIRTIFAQPGAEHVRDQRDVIATMLGRYFPKVEAMLREVAEVITAFDGSPTAYWKKIWSTNPLKRVSEEIRRRTDVVGVFPNPAVFQRLAGAVLIDYGDEWHVTSHCYL